MGDKQTDIRNIFIAILGIAVLVVIANYAYNNIPGSSAWNPNPIDVSEDVLPWYKGPSETVTAPISYSEISFSDPIQLTGNPNDSWEEEYGFKFSEWHEWTRDIYEDSVLFSCNFGSSPTFSRLFLYNIKENDVKEIFLPGDGYIYDANIWGDNVAVIFNGNVYVYSISNDFLTAVTEDVITEGNSLPNRNLDIYGNSIVWERYEPGNSRMSRIYIYDINDDQSKVLYFSSSSQKKPYIFRNNVIWSTFCSSAPCSLVWYDMKNRKRTVLTVPKIYIGIGEYGLYENIIFWLEKSYYNDYTNQKELYKFDMNTGNKYVVKSSREDGLGSYSFNFWKHFFVWNKHDFSDGGYYRSMTLFDSLKNKEYNIVEDFPSSPGWGFQDSEIFGSEFAFIYPQDPPYPFRIIFNKQTANHDMYLIEAQIN